MSAERHQQCVAIHIAIRHCLDSSHIDRINLLPQIDLSELRQCCRRRQSLKLIIS